MGNGSAACRSVVVTGQTIWREGYRIRRTDGGGYSDRVTDDRIREHIQANLYDPLFIAFAKAVLAIRAFERASQGASS